MTNLPFREFGANAVWLQLVLIAGDLNAWAQGTLLTGEARTWEPKRLRYALLHVGARLSRSGRRLSLRLQRTWPWSALLATAFARLRTRPASADIDPLTDSPADGGSMLMDRVSSRLQTSTPAPATVTSSQPPSPFTTWPLRLPSIDRNTPSSSSECERSGLGQAWIRGTCACSGNSDREVLGMLHSVADAVGHSEECCCSWADRPEGSGGRVIAEPSEVHGRQDIGGRIRDVRPTTWHSDLDDGVARNPIAVSSLEISGDHNQPTILDVSL